MHNKDKDQFTISDSDKLIFLGKQENSVKITEN